MFTQSFVSRPAVDLFRNEFDQLFGELFRPHGRAAYRSPQSCKPMAGAVPAINVWEDEGSFHLEAEVPGLKAEDLEIVVVGEEVTISGTRKDPLSETTRLHRRERTAGQFKRIIKVNSQLDPVKVSAGLKDGVLTITLPKAEVSKPRKITIRPEVG